MSDRTREPQDRGRLDRRSAARRFRPSCRSCRCATRCCFRIRSCRSRSRARAPSASSTTRSPNGKLIAVFTQRDASVEEPAQDDLLPVGTATHIHKMFKLPDGSLRLIVQGLARLSSTRSSATQPYLRARVNAAAEDTDDADRLEIDALRAQHQDQLPAGRVAVAAAVRRSADARDEHHRAGPARRLHRLEPDDHQHRRSSRKCSRRSTSARAWTT